MQLENGKIIAIRTAFKVGGAGKGAGAQDIKADNKPTSFLGADKDDLKKGESFSSVAVYMFQSQILCFGHSFDVSVAASMFHPLNMTSLSPHSV